MTTSIVESSLDVPPSAARLVFSLRDLGYELPQAIAELVDNALDANAGCVDVDFGFAADRSWVLISDDGTGMCERDLDEAMRFGSRRTYDQDSLGGFGLGLKTASFSQCRRLTVASRTSAGRLTARAWNLDDILRSDRWRLQRVNERDLPPQLAKVLTRPGAGTWVLWEHLDRILLLRDPSGGVAENTLDNLARDTAVHLAMVFHRYIAGEARRGRPVVLRVNGCGVGPWDPFARGEAHTRALKPQVLEMLQAGTRIVVRVSPYILPHQLSFSSAAAHNVAGGPGRWNRQQGFYVYRFDRLIQAGGWNRLRTSDEHTKLARVAVDLPSGFDELFGVNVSKLRVAFPRELRAPLRALAAGVATLAKTAYQSPSAKPAEENDVEDPPNRPRAPRFVGWRTLERVLQEELGDPQVVQRVLSALVGSRETRNSR